MFSCLFFFLKLACCMHEILWVHNLDWAAFGILYLNLHADADVAVNGETLFRDVQIIGFLSSTRENVIIKRFITTIIRNFSSKGLNCDDHVKSENIFRPPRPSPPPPSAPSGPVQFSREINKLQKKLEWRHNYHAIINIG